jgi:hypothetical protein
MEIFMKQLLKSSFVVLTLTFAGMAAEATPAVGEKSVFAVNLAKGQQTADGTMTLELTAFDAGTDTWTMVTTTMFNGHEEKKTTPTKTADLIGDAMIDQVLGNCVASGGTVDTVVSPVGNIPACALPINDNESTGTLWVSKVPFGYSKWTTRRSDGMTVTGVLQSYSPAAPAK